MLTGCIVKNVKFFIGATLLKTMKANALLFLLRVHSQMEKPVEGRELASGSVR